MKYVGIQLSALVFAFDQLSQPNSQSAERTILGNQGCEREHLQVGAEELSENVFNKRAAQERGATKCVLVFF